MIDTAQAYQNEEGVGNAWCKSGIKREELFLVTKVWISNAGEEKAAKSIDKSLRKLQTDYIDLLLIHQAYGDVFGTWRAYVAYLVPGWHNIFEELTLDKQISFGSIQIIVVSLQIEI